MKRGMVLLFFIGVVSSVSPAQRSSALDSLSGLLEWAAAEMLADGYTPTEAPKVGRLGHGATTYVSVSMLANRDYQIIGVCDDQCTDLDLQLFSPQQQLLDADHSADALPVVFTSPRTSGTYYIRIWMNGCSSSICEFGIGTFTRSR